jgi:hypothetical protein
MFLCNLKFCYDLKFVLAFGFIVFNFYLFIFCFAFLFLIFDEFVFLAFWLAVVPAYFLFQTIFLCLFV